MIAPYRRVSLGIDSSRRDIRTNRRTRAMLRHVEKKLQRKLIVTQGGYLQSAAAASADTHRGPALDIRTRDLASKGLTPNMVVRALREAGFAAWFRNWSDPHIHAIPLGDPGLSAGARAQEVDYRRGRNGLADNGPDDGPKVPIRTWEEVTAKTPISASAVRAAFGGHRKEPKHVLRVQRALRKKGFLTGPVIPGNAGSKTISAWRLFELSVGHAANGKIALDEIKVLVKGTKYKAVD